MNAHPHIHINIDVGQSDTQTPLLHLYIWRPMEEASVV